LCSMGVFNANLMNDAIFKFKRYEDSSLSYTGIDRHADEDVGGWDTVIRREQYEQLFYNQQNTMVVEEREDKPEIETIIEIEKPKPVTSVAAHAQKTSTPNGITTKKPITSAYSSGSLEKQDYPVKKPTSVIEMDLSGVKVGATVTHKSFGTGEIVWMDKAEKHIRVKFAAGEKNFVFPNAFLQGFLKI